MVFETGSDNKKIDEIQKQLDDVLDSQLFSSGGNENLSIDATRGQRNDASGDAGGVRSNEPVIHKITDVNEAGTPTTVFDKINLISSMIIVDHTSTPMKLKFIQGLAKEGAKIKITPKKDKVLVIESGGNILTTTDITISDTEYYELVKHSEAETGITGGSYKILKIGAGGGASGYVTIQDEGTPVTQRSTMNFIGGGVVAIDNAGQSRTDITISGGSSEFFGPWTNTHDAGNQLLDKLNKINFNILNQSIASDVSGIIYTSPDVKAHIFKSLTDEIARFEEEAAGVFRLNMKQHSIRDTKDISFDVNATSSLPSNVPGIGFDTTQGALKINVPDGKQHNLEFDGTKIYDFTIARMTGPAIILSNFLSLSDAAINPTSAGMFRRNGADVKVFTGGVVKNLSDIPSVAGANINLSNLGVTAINADLLFNAGTHDIGNTTNSVKNIFTQSVRLQTGILTANKPTITSLTGDTFDINFPTGSTFNIHEAGLIKHTFTATSYNSPNIIINGELTINDSSGFPASVGGIKRSGNVLGMKFDTLSVRRDTILPGDDPRMDIVRVDTSPNNNDKVGKLRFRIFDDPTETTYGQIAVTVTDVLNSSTVSIDAYADGGLLSALAFLGNDNNQNFTIIAGGLKPRLQPFNGPMGYFVTSQVLDFSKNIGTGGTVEIPHLTDGSPSDNDLNQAAGDFNSVVIFDFADGSLYIRINSTTWRKFTSTLN